jgi:hypothetical protein
VNAPELMPLDLPKSDAEIQRELFWGRLKKYGYTLHRPAPAGFRAFSCDSRAVTPTRYPGAFLRASKIGPSEAFADREFCEKCPTYRGFCYLERAKGLEPSTPTLARSCSTTELHPRPKALAAALRRQPQSYAKCAVRMQQFEDGPGTGKSAIFGLVSSKTGQNRFATPLLRCNLPRNRSNVPPDRRWK